MKTTRTWYLATAAAVALILLAGWFLLISPKKSAAADLRAQTKTAEGTAATLRAELTQLRTQAAGLGVEQRRLRTFEKKMPATVAMPELIRALSGAASTSQADLISLAPGVPVAPTATAPAAAATPSPAIAAPTPMTSTPPTVGAVPPVGAAGSGGAAPYSVVPLVMTVHGEYFVLQRFFTALEALPRALVLTSVALAPLPASEAGSTTGAPVLTATLSGSAYVSALPPVPTVSPPGAVPSPAPYLPPSGNALAPQAAGTASPRR